MKMTAIQSPAKTTDQVSVQVVEEHHVVRAQRAARSFAGRLDLTQVITYSIATAVSELANNLCFHASGGGIITLAALRQNGKVGMEVIAEDQGPGIPDLALAMQDGFSTSGGLGGGLPGVERLMDEFEIHSAPSKGTRVVARKWQQMKKQRGRSRPAVLRFQLCVSRWQPTK